MKESRTRTLTLAAALATLGMVVSAASCTGPATKKAESSSKTTGPAIAKGDKTTAMPGASSTPGAEGETAAADTTPEAAGDTPTPPPLILPQPLPPIKHYLHNSKPDPDPTNPNSKPCGLL